MLKLMHSLSLKTENPPSFQIVAVLDDSSSAAEIAQAAAEAINLARATCESSYILVATHDQAKADEMIQFIAATVQAFVHVVEPDRWGHNGRTESFGVKTEATAVAFDDLRLLKVTIDFVTHDADS